MACGGFDTQVMGINARAELHFLDGGSVLVFFGFLLLLGEFITELAEVHQTADGGNGVGRNLDEVHSMGAGQVDGIIQLNAFSHKLLLLSTPMTRTSRARIFPLTRMNDAGDELRGGKGRLKRPSLVET